MRNFHFLAAAVLFAGLAQTSSASIITHGQFAIGGTIYVTDASGAFNNPGLGGVAIAGMGTTTCPVTVLCIFWQSGSNTTQQVTSISTDGLPSGDIPLSIAGTNSANLYNLTNPPNGVGSPGFTDQPFLDFAAGGSGVTTVLEINFINPGIFLPTCTAPPAPAAGQSCTTPGSLFSFLNTTATSSIAAWVMSGETSGNTALPPESWTGVFTAQFNIPFQTVLTNLQTNHYVSNTYSGTITLDNAPEPGSLVLIGSGLLGLGMLLRRRRAR